jgi:Ca2+-binding RTX toxin-like protein
MVRVRKHRRRLRLERLEDRVVPVTLTELLNAYNNGASILAQVSTAIADQALGQHIPLVNETLSSALSLGRDIQTPFQTQLNGPDWDTVRSNLENAGFTVLAPFTGNPDVNGNLLLISWSRTLDNPSILFTASGQTGFSYLDSATGDLLGAISAQAQNLTFQATLGVDLVSGQPTFYLADSSGLQVNGLASTSGSVTGNLALGSLGDVDVNANASLSVSSAGVGLNNVHGNHRLRTTDFTSGPALAASVQGNLQGSVQLTASLTAHLSFLSDLNWSGTFSGSITTAGWQAGNVSLNPPSAQSVLLGLGRQFFSLSGGIPLLGSLASQLSQPLPLIDQSIGQLTGLSGRLPGLPNPGDLTFSDTPYTLPLGPGTLTVNVTTSALDALIHGQPVDLLSWTTGRHTVPLIDRNITIPLYSFGVPDIASVDIDATFGLHASLNYDVGFGIDTRGFWLKAGSQADPTLGLSFGVTAGLEGQLEVFGFPLARAGGNLGFSITPYVTLTAPPYSANPNKVYASDLALFGSNPVTDFLDALSVGIRGDLTGSIYASIDLLFFSVSWSWGVNIPVFNFVHNPAWPALGGNGAGGSDPYPVGPDANGVLTFNGSSAADNVTLKQIGDQVQLNWANHGPTHTYRGVREFVFHGNGGDDRLNTGRGFTIPIVADVPSGNAFVKGGDGGNTLIGGSGNDTLVGGQGNDSITGGTGNNILVAGDGNSTLRAGSGNDQLFGGAGNCQLFGGAGNDSIYAGSGNDTIHGGSGIYLIDGGTGNDVIYGDTGHNGVIHAGSGNSLIYGSTSPTLIYGDGGSDTIYGGSGSDTIHAGSGGGNVIYGGRNGVVYNGSGDLIFGGTGNDVIYGNGGNNTIYGGSGTETLYGGDGQNLVPNATGTGLINAAGDGLATGNNLIVAGPGPTVIYGDSTGHNTLHAGAGRDTLFAGIGGDYLAAGAGADGLYGGPGDDSFQLPFTPNGQVQDTVVGGPGLDTIVLKPNAVDTPEKLVNAVADTTSTTLTVTAATIADILRTNPQGTGVVIQIDNEEMFVNSVSGGNVTVTRGYNGTTPVAHAANTPVSLALEDSLTAAVNNTATTITVADGSEFRRANLASGYIILVDSERMLVTGISGNNLTVRRGYDHTTAAAHDASASVLVLPASSSLTPANNRITFTQVAGTTNRFLATLTNLDSGAFIGQVDLTMPPDVEDVALEGGPGDNLIQVDPSVTRNLFLYGGPGHNTLMGGSGNDTLVGGPGSSVIYGGSGDDVIYGGDMPTQDLRPVLDPYGTITDRVLPPEHNTLVAGSGNDQLFAGKGGDVLIGGSAVLQNGQFVLVPGAGRDVLVGGAGNDILIIGPGSPGGILFAGSGNDMVVADNTGADILEGSTGSGSALLLGGNLNNIMLGGTGNDTLVGGEGIDFLQAGAGADSLYADGSPALWVRAQAAATARNVRFDPPPSVVQGDPRDAFRQLGAEDDALQAQINALLDLQQHQMLTPAQHSLLISLLNEDTLILQERIIVNQILGANIVVDTLVGGAGADQLYGSPAAATWMTGGTGNDTFYNYNGNDTIQGGGGTNTLMFQGDGTISLVHVQVGGQDAVQVSINAQQWTVGNLGNISRLNAIGMQTLNGDDTVTVNFGTWAGLGVYVQAGDGNDLIDAVAYQGHATLRGGAGTDTIRISTQLATGSVVQGGTGNSELDIQGSNGGDQVTVTGGVLTVDGVRESGAGFQKLVVMGGSGSNTFSLDSTIPNVVFVGGSGTNALTIQGDNHNGNTFHLSQTGSTIMVTGTVNVTATNMTSVTVKSGGGNNDVLDASGMILGVTLDGQGGRYDTLLGGAGDDTLYFYPPASTPWDAAGVYDGGQGTGNRLICVTPAGVTSYGYSYINRTFAYSYGQSGYINVLTNFRVQNMEQFGFSINHGPVVGIVPVDYSLAITGISAGAGTAPLAQVTATFTDADSSGTASTDTPWINWGDGATTAGTASGHFTATGSHIYATNATHAITLTVIDSGGAAAQSNTTFTGGLALQGNGDLRNYVGSAFTVVDSGVRSFLVWNPNAPTIPAIFVLHTDGGLFLLRSGARQQIDGGVQTIAIGQDGKLYGLHADGNLYAGVLGSSLTFSEGSVRSLTQDTNGNLYKLKTDGSLSRLQTNSTWALLRQNVRLVALTSDGTALNVMDTAGNYYRYDGSTWTLLAGPHFTVNVAGTTTAGQALSLTLTVFDALNVQVSAYTGMVHFTSSDVAASLPADYTFTPTDAGSHTFTITLKTAGNQTVTLTASGASAQASLVVTPASAVFFGVTSASSTVVAGTPVTVTVTAYDLYGNVATGYQGTVHLSTTDTQGQVPADYLFTQSDAGSHVFTVTLKTAGGQTVTAHDTQSSSLVGSSSVTVSPAAVTSIQVGVPGNPVTAGTPCVVTVTALDAYNNVVNGYRGTVHLSSSDTQAMLPADYTFTATDNGTHAFSVILETAGNQTVTATDTQTGTLTSSVSVTVNAAAVAGFQVSVSATTVTAGVSLTVTVTAVDAYGNVITGYQGSIHFTSSDGQASLPGDYTFTPDDNGTHTFTATLLTAGTQSIMVTDLDTGLLTGASGNIAVNAAVADHFQITVSPGITSGTPFDLTVTVLDAFGNVVLGYQGTITFTVTDSDPNVVIPVPYTFSPDSDAGVHTFAAGFVLITPGDQTITVTDDGGLSGSITVTL